jgi:hypothetical protein
MWSPDSADSARFALATALDEHVFAVVSMTNVLMKKR